MRTHFRVRCRRAAPLLNRLIRAGLAPDHVRTEKGSLSFDLCVSEGRIAERLLVEAGCEYEVTGFRGGRALLRRLFSRPFLLAAAVIALVGVLLLDGFVYDYSIRGNRYVRTEAIASVLRDNRMDGFTAKSELDLSRIKREIVALDGVSFASVKVVGTSLEVVVKESLPVEEPESPQYEPILSSHAAVVTRIVAESGTPRVSVGERVEAGALLIEPIYTFTEGDAPAPARGEVWGVVTHSREVVLPAMTVERILTGESVSRRVVTLFGRRVGTVEPPPYDAYELSERVIYRGIGVTVTEQTYRRIERGAVYHDFDREAELVLRRAVLDLLLEVPCDARERSSIRVTQKRLDNMLLTVVYYTTEQRIDSLSLVP